jgi:ABC-2 type transport system ATP-binding protein
MNAILDLDAVNRRFRTDAGVADLRLSVGAGEVVALVGLNGAGKTTLLKLALGMLRPDAGEVRIDGTPLRRAPADAWARVGHFVDGPALYGELTVRQNLELAARMRGADVGVVEKSLGDFALGGLARRRVRHLSLGNRQRVGLAAALQHRPRLLILDEPGNALDPAGILLLRDLLLERRAAGAGVLVSSHHLDEVARIADRIVVMNRGRLIGSLQPGDTDLERALFEHVRADDLVRSDS